MPAEMPGGVTTWFEKELAPFSVWRQAVHADKGGFTLRVRHKQLLIIPFSIYYPSDFYNSITVVYDIENKIVIDDQHSMLILQPILVRITMAGKRELLQTRNGFVQLVNKFGCGLWRMTLAANVPDDV
jgi:hypothetical protein